MKPVDRAQRVEHLLEAMLDRGSRAFDRADAALEIRWANVGQEVDERNVLHLVDPIPSEWRSARVVAALIEVCTDPSEYVPLWLEAAEELGYIWVDQGSSSGADPARLHPGARANVERLQHASPSQP